MESLEGKSMFWLDNELHVSQFYFNIHRNEFVAIQLKPYLSLFCIFIQDTRNRF